MSEKTILLTLVHYLAGLKKAAEKVTQMATMPEDHDNPMYSSIFWFRNRYFVRLLSSWKPIFAGYGVAIRAAGSSGIL